jgi:hypothetical protein
VHGQQRVRRHGPRGQLLPHGHDESVPGHVPRVLPDGRQPRGPRVRARARRCGTVNHHSHGPQLLPARPLNATQRRKRSITPSGAAQLQQFARIIARLPTRYSQQQNQPTNPPTTPPPSLT